MSQDTKWIAVVCVLPFLACAVEQGNDDQADIGEVAQAIGPECSAAAATATFVGGASYTSPQTYTTTSCFKAVVIDIADYSAAFLGAGDVPGGTYISWNDGVPTTESACNASYVRADLFEFSGAWVYKGFKNAHGAWTSGGLFTGCLLLPGTGFTSADLQAGHTYRIAATARTAATSTAATRRVRVVSQGPVVMK